MCLQMCQLISQKTNFIKFHFILSKMLYHIYKMLYIHKNKIDGEMCAYVVVSLYRAFACHHASLLCVCVVLSEITASLHLRTKRGTRHLLRLCLPFTNFHSPFSMHYSPFAIYYSQPTRNIRCAIVWICSSAGAFAFRE